MKKETLGKICEGACFVLLPVTGLICIIKERKRRRELERELNEAVFARKLADLTSSMLEYTSNVLSEQNETLKQENEKLKEQLNSKKKGS